MMRFVALLNHSTFRLYFGHHLLFYFIKILSGSRNYTSKVHHRLGRMRQTSFDYSVSQSQSVFDYLVFILITAFCFSFHIKY